MALTEGECNQCQVELGKLKTLPAELRWLPEAQARMGKLEAALDSECSSSDGSSSDDSSSDAGAGAVVVGIMGLGLLAAFLTALFGSRQ